MDFLKADSLPWLAAPRQRLRDSLRANRLPHSLLVLASPGLGAEYFAQWAGGLALCETAARADAAADPCGRCGSCLLLRADTHPDYHVVRLEDDAQQIKVDQVRELIQSLTLSSYRGGYKVGIIEGAETLNANGANAFLKTLEEPTDRTLLIMLARPTHRLPATIASRCLRLVLRPPARDAAIAWLENQGAEPAPGAARTWQAALELAGGGPLRALELPAAELAQLDADMRESLQRLAANALDVTLLAEHWLKSNPALRIAWLENWITRRIIGQLGGGESPQSGERVRLPAAVLKPKMRALFELLDAARDLRRLASTGMNQQLALEAVLLDGRKALTK